jgi:tetratricopeptide (TPR) repeat protein
MLLYDTTLRVPMILAGDGVAHGVVVETPASSVDVAPTLLELCGLDHGDVSGISWAARVRDAGGGAAAGGETAADPGEARPLYYEILSPYFTYGWSPLFAVGLGSKIFIDGPHAELFDVAADANQTRNLADAQSDVVRVARLQFERWRTAAAAPADRPDLSQEERARIAKLGYAGAFAASDLAIPLPGQVDAKRRDPRDGAEIVHKMFEAETLLTQGKAKAANERAGELLKIDGDNPMVQQLAGTTLLAAGDAAAALPLLEKAVKSRGDSITRFTLAQALKQLGRRDDSLALLERLVAEQGEFLRARLLYGELLLDAGRKTDAAVQLEYFVAHDPRNDDSKQKAQQLLERARAR